MDAWRELAGGLLFPEGPVAMRDGSVVLVEIARGTLTRIAADGTRSIVAETGGGPNGLERFPIKVDRKPLSLCLLASNFIRSGDST